MTEARYARDWDDFRRWCQASGHAAPPASPATLAAYLRALTQLGPGALARRLSAINLQHRQRGLPPPSDPAIKATPRLVPEPPPVHVVGMGCDVAHAPDLVYADGIDLARAAVGIGLSCRLCHRDDCRSRAFPPLEHHLELDPSVTGASPWRFRKP